MSDVNKEVKQEETNSLAPIPEKDRIMGWGSNTMLCLVDVFLSEHWQWICTDGSRTEPVAVIPRSSN